MLNPPNASVSMPHFYKPAKRNATLMETKHQPPFQDQWAQEKVSTPSTRHQVDSPYPPTIISVPVLSGRVRSINCLLWSSDSFTTTTKQQHSQAIPFKRAQCMQSQKVICTVVVTCCIQTALFSFWVGAGIHLWKSPLEESVTKHVGLWNKVCCF